MEQNKTEYRILSADTLEAIEALTRALLGEGWQPAANVDFLNGEYIHEMVKFPAPNQSAADTEALNQHLIEQFSKKYDALDPKLRDLLEINDIHFMCQNGRFYTMANGKILDGISSTEVLSLLKNSPHYPIDTPDDWVLNEIEGLV